MLSSRSASHGPTRTASCLSCIPVSHSLRCNRSVAGRRPDGFLDLLFSSKPIAQALSGSEAPLLSQVVGGNRYHTVPLRLLRWVERGRHGFLGHEGTLPWPCGEAPVEQVLRRESVAAYGWSRGRCTTPKQAPTHSFHINKSQTVDTKSHNGTLNVSRSFRHHAPRCELCLIFGGLVWKKALWMCNAPHPASISFSAATAVSPRSSLSSAPGIWSLAVAAALNWNTVPARAWKPPWPAPWPFWCCSFRLLPRLS